MNDKEVLVARGAKGLRKHHRQRIKRGWSIFDAWSADGHLLRQIGELALYYRNHKVGYPGCLEEAEWDDILTRIGEPLVDYADRQFDVPMDDPMFDRAREALELFASWHAHFWN